MKEEKDVEEEEEEEEEEENVKEDVEEYQRWGVRGDGDGEKR